MSPFSCPDPQCHRRWIPGEHPCGTNQPSNCRGWQGTNCPGEPNTDISYAIFTDNGTRADAWYGHLMSVGEWRETGDRSADLVIVTHELISLDELFGQSPIAVPKDLYEGTPLTL